MIRQPLNTIEPPHSYEAEAALIGSAILAGDSQTLGTIWSEVDASRFYVENHARIWEAIGQCWVHHGRIDGVLLKEAVKDDALLDAAIKCAEQTPTMANWPHWAKIVNTKHRLRTLIAACEQSAWDLAKCDDADATITRVMDRLSVAGRNLTPDECVQLADAERRLLAMLESGKPTSIPTSLPDFDAEFGGIPLGGLVCVFGYPASGKTTLTLNVAERMAKQGLPVRVFSYEQNATRLAATMLSTASGMQVHTWLNEGYKPGEEQWNELNRAIEAHAALDFGLIDRSLDAPGIFRECQAANLRTGRPGVAVVDYVQNLPGFGVFQELSPRITESMRWMQRIARDLGWTVLLVSQLDKAAAKANQRPDMASGLGSSAIEQYSDMIVSVYRPYQREPMGGLDRETWQRRQRCCELGVLKNKYGPNGSVSLAFDLHLMRFRTPTEAEVMAWA